MERQGRIAFVVRGNIANAHFPCLRLGARETLFFQRARRREVRWNDCGDFPFAKDPIHVKAPGKAVQPFSCPKDQSCPAPPGKVRIMQSRKDDSDRDQDHVEEVECLIISRPERVQ